METKKDITEMNVLERISSNLEDLSKTHKKIAVYILENYDKAVFQTSSQLAKLCDVSESSVIRFANCIDYNGYSDMQKALQDFLKEKITISQRLESISENTSDEMDILYNVLQKSLNDINWLINNINEDTFLRIVDLLSNSKRVFLVGSRSSYSVTYFLGLGLKWIRNNVFVLDGINRNFDDLSKIEPGDVLLSVSLPRYLNTTLQIHEYAYKKGAQTICITDTITSPLVKFSTVPLLINNELLSFSDNLIPVMCIVTGILNSVAARNKDSKEKIENLERFWNELEIYQKYNSI
ncbi:MurR/RpiR family transcriptional regulator [Anaerosphaera multitolerans]|uniref:MurR/RpiR family transcriptional regulator n=1 Tax=Anaerosphaera multitolerans TaxID=2487351 RepID=A0A437S4M1_9FIRM|nr:MurR/RpiR family transcriptional regulator [Anaerosphaera multitolerans]RVU53906.1 MurR/RpiR family transcriptional regulator [Anaerosphaera multitolerans]